MMNLSQTIQHIDLLKKEAEKLMPLSEEYKRNFWWKFRLDFNYNSNHLEGNTLTYGHTHILLRSGDVVGKYNIRELQEMKAHDLALKNIREAAEEPEFTLTQKFIKEINEIILVEPFYNDAITNDGRKTKKLITPGQYKSTPNSVLMANGEMFYYPSPEETPALMGDLIDWYEAESKEAKLHPVQLAALFHYKFVRIHPFDDSNGRTARLLMNYILLKNNYAPLVIESIDKKNYLISLNEADAGNVEAFVEYISGIALKWQHLFASAAEGKEIEENNDIFKEIELLKQKIDYSSEIEKTFSSQTLKTAYLKSLQPFLIQVFEKLSIFDTYFLKREIHFSGGAGSGTIKSVQNDFAQYVNKILEDQQVKPFTWNFFVIHKNLSKTNNVLFSYTTNFDVLFDKNFYLVKSIQLPTLIIKKLYHQVIEEIETENFIRILLKKELEAIKKEIGDF